MTPVTEMSSNYQVSQVLSIVNVVNRLVMCSFN